MNNAGNIEQFSLFSTLDSAAEEKAASGVPSGKFSNFIVYVDESGDHSMISVDQNLPGIRAGSLCVLQAALCRKDRTRTA